MPAPPRCRALDEVFPGRVATLRERITQDIALCPALASSVPPALSAACQGPSGAAVRDLLDGGLVVRVRNTPISAGATPTAAATLRDLVVSFATSVRQRMGASGSVLCAGGGGARFGRGNDHPNAAMEELASPRWMALHAAVGDAVIRHLLSACMVCVPLSAPRCGTVCFLQCTGPPFQAPPQKRRMAPQSGGESGGGAGGNESEGGDGVQWAGHAAESIAVSGAGEESIRKGGRGSGGRPGARRRRKGKSVATAEPEADVGCGIAGRSEEREAGGRAGEGGGRTDGMGKRRRPRPRSWVRRLKNRRAEEVAAREADGRDVQAPVGGGGTRGAAARGQGERGIRAGRTNGAGGTLADLTRTMLPRFSLFYCSSFRRSPGLPKCHVISALPRTLSGAKTLLGCIFPKDGLLRSPVTGAPQAAQRGHARQGGRPSGRAQVPLSVGRTLTRRHMRALPDVLRMMQRLDSCPFARLLRRHCPLKLRSARNGGSGERKGGSVGEERGMDGGLERGDGTGGHGEGRNGRGEEGQRGSGQDRRDVRAIKEGEDEVGAERVRGREVSSALHSDMSGAAGDGCSDVGASSGMGSEKGQKKGDGDVRCGGEGGSGGEREGGSGIRESAGEIEGSSESESEGSDEEGTGTSAKTRGPGHTDISAVARFVWAVVRWVVPETLLGDKRSRSALRRSIATLLCKKRHEGMTLGEAVRGLRTKTGPWACGKGGGRAEQRLAQRDTLCWTWFLMSWIVIPTLRAHFYATESEKHRYSVFYFRKADWARLRREALDEMERSELARVRTTVARDAMKRGGLGHGSVRFIPKRGATLRPIVTLSKRAMLMSRSGPLRAASVNESLRPVFEILRHEARANPASTGASVRGYGEIFARLKPLVGRWRQDAAGQEKPMRPFIFAADISRAFDSIRPSSALRSAEALLRSDTYTLRRFAGWIMSRGTVRFRPIYACVPSSHSAPNVTVCHAIAQACESHWAPLVTDTGAKETFPRQKVSQLLQSHLEEGVVRSRGRWYMRVKGIPQGSILSTLLCTLVLADAERRHLGFGAGGLLLTGVASGCEASMRPGEQGGALMQLAVETERALGLSEMSGGEEGGETGSGMDAGGREGKGRSASGKRGRDKRDGKRGRATKRLRHMETQMGPDRGADEGEGVEEDQRDGQEGRGDAGGGEYTLEGDDLREERAGEREEGGVGRTLMMRMVDDYLVIAGDRATAEKAMARLIEGFADCGVAVNPEKTKANFSVKPRGGGRRGREGGSAGQHLHVGADGSLWVRWCGLMVNARTLQVMADYTRYHGDDITRSINVPAGPFPGSALAQRVCSYLGPKCVPLLFDKVINGPLTARVNVYQACMVAAMKMHSYLRGLPDPPFSNARLILRAIHQAIQFLPRLMRTRALAVARRTGVPCAVAVSPTHARYLCGHAFYTVLKRKHARYPRVLEELKGWLEARTLSQAARHLAPVVDPRRHDALQLLRF